MLCRKPYLMGGTVPVGCGQCIPCRVNRRRVWTIRQVLEANLHEESSFVTLTYDEEHVICTEKTGLPTLVPQHHRAFYLSLRKRLLRHNLPAVRFYMCGEYGEQTERPHYHYSMFGLSPMSLDLVQESWKYGFVHLTEFSEQTASYVAGYIMKKMTSDTDQRLNGRFPEFTRMSNRPGIGADSMPLVAKALQTEAGSRELTRMGDVPRSVRFQGKKWPLGRYLRRCLRQQIGFSDEQIEAIKQSFLDGQAAEMLRLLKTAEGDDRKLSLGQLASRQHQTSAASLEAKVKIYNSRERGL